MKGEKMDALDRALERDAKEKALKKGEGDRVIRDLRIQVKPHADMASSWIKEIDQAYLRASVVMGKIRQTSYAKDLDIDRRMMEIEGLGQNAEILKKTLNEYESLCWD